MKCLQNKYELLGQKLGDHLNDIKKTFIKVQIQYTYLGFLLIYLSCINEINYIWSTSFSWTFVFPWTFMLLCVIVLSLNLFSSLTEYCPKWLKAYYSSLIIQTEENKDPIRLYRFVRLTYLLLLSTVVCISNDKSVQLNLMLILQICYLYYLFTYRPLGSEMNVQSLIFGCLECVYTVIFIISKEVNLLLILILIVSQLLLLAQILINSRIRARFCSKSGSSVENVQNISENNQDKSENKDNEINLKESFEFDKTFLNPGCWNEERCSNIKEETKYQSDKNRYSLSKDTDWKEKEINSGQEDEICIDITGSKLYDFNKSKLNNIEKSRPKTARRNNLM